MWFGFPRGLDRGIIGRSGWGVEVVTVGCGDYRLWCPSRFIYRKFYLSTAHPSVNSCKKLKAYHWIIHFVLPCRSFTKKTILDLDCLVGN